MTTSIHSPRCRPARLIGARVMMLVCAARLACGDLAQAEIVYSGTQNIAIPTDFNGVFIDVFSLQHSTTEFGGWDLNPFFGGLGIANSPDFQPVRIGTGNEDSIAPITFGSIINGSALFSSDYGMSGAEDDSGHLGPSAGQFGDGQSAYLGFQLTHGNASFFGWMRLTLSSNGNSGVVQNWAYDNSGAAIRAGAIGDVGAAPKIVRAGETQAASAASAGSAIMLDAGSNFTFQENASEGHFTGNIQGGGELNVSGAGGLRLSGSNSFSGTAAVLAGSRLTVTTKDNLGTAAVQLNSASALVFESLAANNGSKNTYANAITVTTETGTLRNTGNGTVVLTGGLSKNGSILAFSAGSFEVSGSITGSSANSDLVVDAATVTLLTSNSYNGPTFIRSGGILNAAAAGALPTSLARSAIVLDDSGSGYSQLRLSAANQSISSLSGSATSSVNLSADVSPHLLTIGNSLGLNASDFAGGVTGSGGLVKDGTSIQILSGANSFTGSTTINGGTLQAAAANALGGTSAVTINSGGLLAVSASSAIHSSALVTLNGASDRTVVFSGSLTNSFGLLALSSTSVVDLGAGSVTLNMANSSALAWAGAATLEIWNWSGQATGGGIDRIFFGTSASSLTLQQLANINIYGDSGQTLLGQSTLLTSGELVAIPEPRCLVLLMSGILLFVRRRARVRFLGSDQEL